jgi:hypothetical protein
MAKLKPTPTHMVLDQVTVTAPTVQYHYTSLTGPPLQIGEDVKVSGFTHTGNNSVTRILALPATPPNVFDTIQFHQSSETHAATAVTTLRRPTHSQKYKVWHNRYGTILSPEPKRTFPQTPRQGHSPWTDIMQLSVWTLNKGFLRGAASRWKHQLTQADRDKWITFASTATVFAYNGKTHTPTGFEAFIAAVRKNTFLDWDPYIIAGNADQANIPTPPTASWTNLGTPHVTLVTDFGGGAIEIDSDTFPGSFNTFMLAQIARPNAPHHHPGTWLNAWNTGTIVNPDPTTGFGTFQIDYPFFKPNTSNPCELAIYFYDSNTYAWGDFTFLSFP